MGDSDLSDGTVTGKDRSRAVLAVFASSSAVLYNQIMSLYLQAVKYKPEFVFILDAYPFKDYSPLNITGSTSAGTPAIGPPLVKGAAHSTIARNTNILQFASTIFARGREKYDFSLKARVYPVKAIPATANGPVQILSNHNNYDGLTINGTVVSFATNYTSTGSAKCSYDIQSLQAFDVVGVHTASKNSLFINGVLVDEVDISPAQQADTYTTTDGSLYSGKNDADVYLMLNGVCGFRYALDGPTIAAMDKEAHDMLEGEDVASIFAGTFIQLSRATSDLFLNQMWSTSDDWKMATMNNVTIMDDQLVPQFDGDTSMAGSWIDSISLGAADTTSIYGVVFDWDGTGATVEASLTGATWETVVKGVGLTTIPPGFNPTDKDLLVRISFAGGVVDDSSFIDNLSVMGFRSAAPTTLAGRPVTFTKAYQQKDYPVRDLNEQWGTEIQATGTIVIGPDSTPLNMQPRTVEVWIKPTTTTLPTISATGTMYQDGVANSGAFVVGKWHLVHIVTASAITGNITITGPAQVGHVILYPAALSASDVATVTKTYAKANPLVVDDITALNVTQSAAGAQVYAHDWSIVGAG